MYCVTVPTSDGKCACPVCKRVFSLTDCSRLKAHCRGEQGAQIETKPPGLGDYAEQLLTSIGVTKDRIVAAKELFGLPPTCNCESRKKWLNSVSDWWRGTPDNPANATATAD